MTFAAVQSSKKRCTESMKEGISDVSKTLYLRTGITKAQDVFSSTTMASALPNYCSQQDLYLSSLLQYISFSSFWPTFLISTPIQLVIQNEESEAMESKRISKYHMLFATF